MARERVTRLNLKKLVGQGRTPIVVDGWTEPYAVIPPQGATPNEELLNEQTGQFASGYGIVVRLTRKRADSLKKRLSGQG